MRKQLLSTLLALCMALALLPGTAGAFSGGSQGQNRSIPTDITVTFQSTDGQAVQFNWANFTAQSSALVSAVSVRFGSPANGKLYLNGAALAVSTHILVTQISGVQYIPNIGSNTQERLTFTAMDANNQTVGSGMVIINVNGNAYLTAPDENEITDTGANTADEAAEVSRTLEGGLTWSYSDGTLTIQGTGALWNRDEAPWYDINEQIQTVIIEDGVTYIDCSWATFGKCSNLTNVTLPDTVTSICSKLFSGCSSLVNVNVPNRVTFIGDDVFNGTSLTSITIPASVTEIGSSAFADCTSLTKIDVASENSNYISIDGILFSADRKILHTYPAGKNDLSYRIPDSVTEIGLGAFTGCSNLTRVTIPNGTIKIGAGAFSECSGLTSVSIPASVATISNAAFVSCNALIDVYYGGTEEEWKEIYIGDINECLLNATIHYNSTGPDQGISTPSTDEYIYDTSDPGENVMLDANRLNSVTDPASAAEAVRDMVNGMTQEQKESPTGIDLATLYAETAVAKATRKSVTGTDILINAANVADLETEAVHPFRSGRRSC